MLYKFVQLPVWNNYATLLNCTSREGCINLRGPGSEVKVLGSGCRLWVLVKVPGSRVPPAGPGSWVPREGSHMEGPEFRVLYMDSGFRVLGPGSHFFAMLKVF